MAKPENRTMKCNMNLDKGEKSFKTKDNIEHTAVSDLLDICNCCKYKGVYCKVKTLIFGVLRELPENEKYKEG